MAENTADGISWLLELRRDHTEWLAGIRHWQHLKIATGGSTIWVTGFQEDEVNHVAIKSIPIKKIWYQKANLLFAQGSIVPSQKAPMLLWTPIERGLPVELPAQNHNFFGVHNRLGISIIQSEAERPAFAMSVTLKALKEFIEQAPAIRLQGLSWTIVNADTAFITGTPLLPLPGRVYWRDGDFLMPAGYDFALSGLTQILQSMMGEDRESYIIWDHAEAWSRIPKTNFKALTIGSFRQSTRMFNATI